MEEKTEKKNKNLSQDIFFIRNENIKNWNDEDFDFYSELDDLLQDIYHDKTPSKQTPSQEKKLD